MADTVVSIPDISSQADRRHATLKQRCRSMTNYFCLEGAERLENLPERRVLYNQHGIHELASPRVILWRMPCTIGQRKLTSDQGARLGDPPAAAELASSLARLRQIQQRRGTWYYVRART